MAKLVVVNADTPSSLYIGMDQATARFAQKSADRIRNLVGRQAQNMMHIGQELLDVRKQLQHGQFLEWVNVELGISARTAQKFMNVAENLGPHFEKLKQLNSTTLYALAATSLTDESRKSVLEVIDKEPSATDQIVQDAIYVAKSSQHAPPTSQEIENLPPSQRMEAKKKFTSA